MNRVVIESPLNAPTREGIELNKDYARRCVMDSLSRGEAPYASHLFFDQPGLLDDLRADQRELGLTAGLAWGESADFIAVYVDNGISNGMKRGINRWRSLGKRIEYRAFDIKICSKHGTDQLQYPCLTCGEEN